MSIRVLFPLVIAAGTLIGAPAAFAAGSHAGGHGHGAGNLEFGKPAEASKASRTVTVVMRDNLYEPETIAVKAGETVRLSSRTRASSCTSSISARRRCTLPTRKR